MNEDSPNTFGRVQKTLYEKNQQPEEAWSRWHTNNASSSSKCWLPFHHGWPCWLYFSFSSETGQTAPCTWRWITWYRPSYRKCLRWCRTTNHCWQHGMQDLPQPFAQFLQAKIYKESPGSKLWWNMACCWPACVWNQHAIVSRFWQKWTRTGVWSKPVSERAYLQRIWTVSDILGQEVTALKLQGELQYMLLIGWICHQTLQKLWCTRWWFQICFIFTPIWGRFPIWLIFFRWVETTS